MRLHRLRLELRMELAAQVPRGIGDLADFHVRIVGRHAGDAQTRGAQLAFVFAVEFVAMAVALVYFAGAIRALGEASLSKAARPASEAHGAAELVDALQFAQLEDDAVRRAGVEFGGIGFLKSGHVTRELNHLRLHTEADAEERHFALAGIANGVQHPIDAALAEAAGHQNAIVTFELMFPIGAMYALGLNPMNVDLQLVRGGAVQQGFLQTLVGVFVFDVLADDGDGYLAARVLHALEHGDPAAEIARRRLYPQ